MNVAVDAHRPTHEIAELDGLIVELLVLSLERLERLILVLVARVVLRDLLEIGFVLLKTTTIVRSFDGRRSTARPLSPR